VALDSAGDIYIADEANNIIRVVNTQSSSVTIVGVTIPAGAINTVAGNYAAGGGDSGDGFQATSAKLLNPLGVALDSAGNIYIADSANNVIRKVSAASGVISTVAGNNALPAGYSGDNGPPISAELNGPSGVVVDSAGNYYIADFANNVIRKVAP
jgi:streptogramin lyase